MVLTPPYSLHSARRGPRCRGFQFTTLDTKYARLLGKSHPGARLALLTDMDTQFDFNGVDDIEVCCCFAMGRPQSERKCCLLVHSCPLHKGQR